MKNRKAALLLAGMLAAAGTFPAAAQEEAVTAPESAPVPAGPETEWKPETLPEENDPQTESGQASEAQEADIPEQAEELPDEEVIREEEFLPQPPKETDRERTEPDEGGEGLIEDTGKVVSDSVPGEPPVLPEDEDIHRGMFPGFEVDPSRYPAANVTENTLELYWFLRRELKLNHAAACGVLANVHLESNFRPIALGDGGTSYGICQWHNGRFSHLMSFCRGEGLDYNTLEGQMAFLKEELENGYRGVYQALEQVEDTAEGAYEAGYLFCLRFEMPDQLHARSERRGNLARNEYYEKDYEKLDEEMKLAAKLRKQYLQSQLGVTELFILESEQM